MAIVIEKLAQHITQRLEDRFALYFEKCRLFPAQIGSVIQAAIQEHWLKESISTLNDTANKVVTAITLDDLVNNMVNGVLTAQSMGQFDGVASRELDVVCTDGKQKKLVLLVTSPECALVARAAVAQHAGGGRVTVEVRDNE